jgi:hypothetical protein
MEPALILALGAALPASTAEPTAGEPRCDEESTWIR